MSQVYGSPISFLTSVMSKEYPLQTMLEEYLPAYGYNTHLAYWETKHPAFLFAQNSYSNNQCNKCGGPDIFCAAQGFNPLQEYIESPLIRTSSPWLCPIPEAVRRNVIFLLLDSQMMVGSLNGRLVRLSDLDFMLVLMILEYCLLSGSMFRHPQLLSAPISCWLNPHLHYLCGPRHL